MGLFDFLFSSNKPSCREVAADKIWLTSEAKFAGLAREVEARSKSDCVAILLVAHFPDVLRRLQEITAMPRAVPVKEVLASDLTPDLAASLQLDKSATIDVIVAERHPLASVDECLEDFVGALPCRCRLSHHLSLEDPILKVFSSEWLPNLLGTLGMKEDESIESELVTRRIKNAQRKLGTNVHGNTDADSAAQWLERNGPGPVMWPDRTDVQHH